jgi:hypothetical protein
MHQREVEKAALAMVLKGALTKDEEHRLRAQIIEKLECTKALQRANEDGNRRCLAMEEAFFKLKQITGVSSLVDMHEKFSSQVGDKSILLLEVKEAEAKLEAVKAAQLRHQASFEDLQSSNSNFNNSNNDNNNNNNNSSGSTGSSSSGKGGYRVTSSGTGNEYMEGGRAGTASMRVALKNNQSDITPSHSTKSNTNTNSNSNISDSSSTSNNNSSNSSPRGPVYPTPYSAFSPRQQDKLSEKAARILNSAGNGIGSGAGAGMRIERSGSTGGTDTVHRTRAANDKYVFTPSVCLIPPMSTWSLSSPSSPFSLLLLCLVSCPFSAILFLSLASNLLFFIFIYSTRNEVIENESMKLKSPNILSNQIK